LPCHRLHRTRKAPAGDGRGGVGDPSCAEGMRRTGQCGTLSRLSRPSSPGPWAVDFDIAKGMQAHVPSMDLIAGFLAGGVAAVFIIGWAITWAARQRRRAQKAFADHGGTVIHGELP